MLRSEGQAALTASAAQEAKRLGFVARSALKLKEIQERFDVVPCGGAVLDLGCSPGAWLQVACLALGPVGGGRVLGVDLKETTPPSRHCDARVSVIRADARTLNSTHLGTSSFHCVLSDMCPDTTGCSSTDAARSAALAHTALALALGLDEQQDGEATLPHGGVLRPGGALVVKLLEGPGGARGELQALCKPRFARVAWVRPKATRSESREVYLVALGRRAS